MPTRKPPVRRPPKRKPAARKPVAPAMPAQRATPAVEASQAPDPPKRPAHRPLYVPTDAHRSNVALMVAAGIEQAMIAHCIGISDKTLRRHYRRELDTAYAMIKVDIAGKLITLARSGDCKACIFYLETHGWVKSETLTVVDSGQEDVARLSDAELEARIQRLRRTAAVVRATRPAASE